MTNTLCRRRLSKLLGEAASAADQRPDPSLLMAWPPGAWPTLQRPSVAEPVRAREPSRATKH